MDFEEYNQEVKKYAIENYEDREFHAYVAWLSNAGMSVLSPWDIAKECDLPRDKEHIPTVVESMKDAYELPENQKHLNFVDLKERYL